MLNVVSADLGQLIQQVAVTGCINFLLWLAFKRGLDRQDREREALENEVRDLRDKRIAGIEKTQGDTSSKRREIYERLNNIEINYVRKSECRAEHDAILDGMRKNAADFSAAIIKLERVATETERLIGWVDDVTKEQISLGKDLSALSASVLRKQGGPK